MSKPVSEVEQRRLSIGVTLPADCSLRMPAGARPRRLAVLLHGYQQNGAYMARKCADAIPEDVAIVAPNALFPVTRRAPAREGEGGENRYSVGYTWYFYNPFADEYVLGMEPAIEYLRALLRSLGVAGLPTSLIGFSQGGYLAPFVAAHLPEVDQVIGIAARFLDEELAETPACRLDAIHGARDGIVSPEDALRSHQALRARGARGEFRMLPETEHRIDDAARAALRELLLKT